MNGKVGILAGGLATSSPGIVMVWNCTSVKRLRQLVCTFTCKRWKHSKNTIKWEFLALLESFKKLSCDKLCKLYKVLKLLNFWNIWDVVCF